MVQPNSVLLVKKPFQYSRSVRNKRYHTNIEQLNISDNFIRRFAIIFVKRNDRMFNSAHKAELVGTVKLVPFVRESFDENQTKNF